MRVGASNDKERHLDELYNEALRRESTTAFGFLKTTLNLSWVWTSFTVNLLIIPSCINGEDGQCLTHLFEAKVFFSLHLPIWTHLPAMNRTI